MKFFKKLFASRADGGDTNGGRVGTLFGPLRWVERDGEVWLARVDVLAALGRSRNSKLHQKLGPEAVIRVQMRREDGRRQMMLAIRDTAASELAALLGRSAIGGAFLTPRRRLGEFNG